MIQKLSNDLIKYIAAGEVIESPYSVVKELIENSIDAHADYISINITDGGMKQIRVLDNGDGIRENDFYLLTERYATSKINAITDLEKLNTLGFRGEALASISTVANLEIISCHKNSIDRTAYRGIYKNGRLISKEEYPHSQGTSIIVQDLFHNTPARKKFVQKPSTETKNIFDLIVKFSVTNPHIKFIFYADNKELFFSSSYAESSSTLLSHLKKLKYKEHLLNIDIEQNNIKIKGFISDQKFVVKRKKYQILTINGRLVDNPTIKKTIEQAYRKYIPKNLYPIYCLQLELDPTLIDVNCHPRKTIVKYAEEDTLCMLLLEIINSLYHHSITEPQQEIDNIFTNEEKDYSIIGQLKNSFLIIENQQTVYFVDQHALHERILYENFKKELKEKVFLGKELEHIIFFNLSSEQMLAYQNKKEILTEYGFEIDLFGFNEIVIRQVPYLIIDNKPEEIQEIVETILDNGKSDWLDQLIIDLSCKSAIKANTILTDEDIRQFIDFMIDNKITNCPHGRPLFFCMSFNEINRKLKRII